MRDNYTIAQLTDSAAQFLRLNNVDVDPSTVDVATCDPLNPDIELCPTDKRKLVRVTASVPVTFSFLPVIGFQIISANYFQATGKPKHAMILSLSRQVMVLIPALLILPRFFGVYGILYAGPLSEINNLSN